MLLLYVFFLATVEDGGNHEYKAHECDERSHYDAGRAEYFVVECCAFIAASAHEKESQRNENQADSNHYIIHLAQWHGLFFLFVSWLFGC